MPQTGKLNALMCTAAPSSGTHTCWPTKLPPFDSGSTRAVEVDVAVRQLPRALAREHQHRADAAVDVDPGIALGRAGRVRERVELGLEVEQALAERAQHGRALVEGHRAQRRAAGFARVAERRARNRGPRSPLPPPPRRCSHRAGRPHGPRRPATRRSRNSAGASRLLLVSASTGRAPGLPGRERRTFGREPCQQPRRLPVALAVRARERVDRFQHAREPDACPRRTSGRPGAAESRSHCTRSRRCRPGSPRCPPPGSARLR